MVGLGAETAFMKNTPFVPHVLRTCESIYYSKVRSAHVAAKARAKARVGEYTIGNTSIPFLVLGDMVQQCNGVCEQDKSSQGGRESLYERGYKRCQICAIFLNWLGLRCPCCNQKLRTKSHNTTKGRKLNALRHMRQTV